MTMIIVFLIVLIMALIIANMLVSIAKPKALNEKGFDGAMTNYEGEVPEVIEKIDSLHENTALIKGALNATNQKIDLLNNRVSTLEKVVTSITIQKIREKN